MRWSRKSFAGLLAFAMLALAGVWNRARLGAEDLPGTDQGRVVLRARFPASGAAPRLALEGQRFQGSPELPCFYERRGFVPAWSEGGTLRREVQELLAALAAAEDDGLRAEDYRPAALARLTAALRSHPEAGGLADLDLLLSDAFLTFAAHLRNGQVNPGAIYRDCALKRDPADLATVLEEALTAGRVRAALAGLAPPHRGYGLLREALGRYRRIAARGGPEPVPPGPTLRAGDRGERVAALRTRLAEAALSDAAEPLPAAEIPDLFDDPLEEAVRGFQRRHGLEDDGVAGPATLAELDQRAEDHVRQIEVNLERWRWLPRDLGRRHVLVNIAAFRLDAVEDGRSALDMRVIVGKPYTRTPMFSSAMEAVILNPSWYVPRSIAVNEIFPKARKDPSYLRRGGYEVLSGSRLRQKPGPQNALGRVKFVFPNRFNVYLHDTPARTLFDRTVRTFSHGCIRIEKPFDLAVWALRDEPQWTPEAIRAGIDAGRERRVPLRRTLPVHVAYWTAWVNEGGTLRLGRDVYERDAELARLLQASSRPKEKAAGGSSANRAIPPRRALPPTLRDGPLRPQRG
ncbi:MAG TPA: L,D-transpeptidase family protein [Thermoanaerobaculia bacterium]